MLDVTLAMVSSEAPKPTLKFHSTPHRLPMATQALQPPAQLSPPPASTIKELSTTLSSLPSLYASQNPNSADVEPVVEEEVPVVDFSMLTQGTPEQRSQAVRDIARACEDWGFFMLVNHGTPESLRAAMLEVFKEFFDLSVEEKREYEDKDVMDPIRYGTSFNTNVEEVRYWRDYLKVMTHPHFNSPAKPPGLRYQLLLRETLQEYSTITREIAIDLLRGIWESLSLEENFMNEALGLGSCWQFVVGNLYPPCPQSELALGLPSHSDFGLLSILHTNGVPGLEVKHNGKWVRVKPIPDAYLINTGDQMEIISNGRYKSVLHRASLNRHSLRMSIVAVIGPSLDTIVVPAPQLVDDKNYPAVFRGIKFRDYMKIQQSSRLKEKSILDSFQLNKGD